MLQKPKAHCWFKNITLPGHVRRAVKPLSKAKSVKPIVADAKPLALGPRALCGTKGHLLIQIKVRCQGRTESAYGQDSPNSALQGTAN